MGRWRGARRASSAVVLSGFVTMASLVPVRASAYCRTSTCKACPRDADTLCTVGGVPLYWPRGCVSYSVEHAASNQVDLATASAVADEAFAKWQAVACDASGAPPSIVAADAFGPSYCNRLEYSTTQGNANVIQFRDDVWPYAGAGNALALTTVSFNSNTGEIYDADMEINSTLKLSTSDVTPDDSYDLLSIITHEAGHFYGLDHSYQGEVQGGVYRDPIMYIALSAMDDTRRDLRADDIAGICAVYPPGRDVGVCNFAPNHGFSAQCALDPATGGGCAVAAASEVASTNEATGNDPTTMTTLGLVGIVAVIGRRRSQGRRSPS